MFISYLAVLFFVKLSPSPLNYYLLELECCCKNSVIFNCRLVTLDPNWFCWIEFSRFELLKLYPVEYSFNFLRDVVCLVFLRSLTFGIKLRSIFGLLLMFKLCWFPFWFKFTIFWLFWLFSPLLLFSSIFLSEFGLEFGSYPQGMGRGVVMHRGSWTNGPGRIGVWLAYQYGRTSQGPPHQNPNQTPKLHCPTIPTLPLPT